MESLLFTNKFYTDNFFVISNDSKLKDIKSKLYGYAIDGCDLYFANPDERLFPITTSGCFVNVVNNSSEIIIQQDYYGGYGLYFFRQGDYWAISNNIYYLTGHVARQFALDINEDFMALMLTMPSGPEAYDETLIKQITRLPLYTEARIEIATRQIVIHEYTIREYYIPIDSPEAFALLDTWHSRWHSLLGHLSKSHYVRADLSGGKDSRAALSVLFKPRINSANICFHNSASGELAKDGPIAKKIAQRLGFALNVNGAAKEILQKSTRQLLQDSLLAKGIYDPYWSAGHYQKNRVFNLGGHAAEVVRGYSKFSALKSVDLLLGLRPDCYAGYIPRAFALMQRTVANLVAKYANEEIGDAQLLLNKTRLRNHFYTAMVENFLANRIILAPIADYQLVRIKKLDAVNSDLDLLFAIILDRYLPEANEIEFDSRKYLRHATTAYARKLNKQYPLQQREFRVTIHDKGQRALPEQEARQPDGRTIDQILYHDFKDGKFGTDIRRLLGKATFAYAGELFAANNFWRNYNLHNLYAIIALINLVNEASGKLLSPESV